MVMSTADKQVIVKEFQAAEGDSGSTAVQVALITARIKDLTGHFQTHKKDFHSRNGLQALVTKRRRLLKYMKRKDLNGYRGLIQKLGLRDSY